VHVLEGGDRELHHAAAWALGRVGDRAAAPALRRCLEADDPRVAAAAARSLGMLRDAESAPALLARLADPSRGELHAACASALSWIGVCGAIPVLLESLEHAGSRASDAGEIALAIARLVGREDAFVKLWRRSRREPLADDSPGGLRARRGRQPDGHAEDLAAIRSFCDERLARDPPAGQEIRILRLSCSA
jgi:HEAT repeat protein